MQPKKRDGVFDWIKGFAIIAVICDHFKFPGISEAWFVWGVQAFVIVTAALASKSQITGQKIFQRLAYIAFVYFLLAFVFHPLNHIFGTDRKNAVLQPFSDPAGSILFNGYFGHLWYLSLYAQMLALFLLLQNKIPRWNMQKVLFAGACLSQIFFLLTYFHLGRFHQIFAVSWIFTIALGWYGFFPLVRWIEEHRRNSAMRCLAAFFCIALILCVPDLRDWFALQERQMFFLNTAFSLLFVYFFTELYYLVRRKESFSPLLRFIETTGHYTLVLYIYHQGAHILFKYGIYEYNAYAAALFSLLSGIFAGRVLEKSYSAAVRFLKTAVLSYPARRSAPSAR